MLNKQVLCKCKLPLLWNNKFEVYLCINCGNLADKNGVPVEIPIEQTTSFIEKTKELQKKILEISLKEEQLKNSK